MKQTTSTPNKGTINISVLKENTLESSSTPSFTLSIPGYETQEGHLSNEGRFILTLRPLSNGSQCPYCGRYSAHIRGRYTRTLQGLPVYGHPCTLRINLRKFRCDNHLCGCKIFCEPLSGLALRYGRRTIRVEALVHEVSVRCTSRIGSRLLKEENISCSASSCLRSAVKYSYPVPRPTAAGIDDFAVRKGHNYGSVLVDQESHKVVAVISGREGEGVRKCLEENPQITRITRDRGRCFIQAINESLPHAAQICDRFHLVSNLLDSMVDELYTRLNAHPSRKAYTLPSKDECLSILSESLMGLHGRRHSEKLELFLKADGLLRKGNSIAEASRQLGVDTRKLYRLTHGHSVREYMSQEQSHILKNINLLADSCSKGIFSIKKLQQMPGLQLTHRELAMATLRLRRYISEGKRKVFEYNRKLKERKEVEHVPRAAIRKVLLGGEAENPTLRKAVGQDSMKKTMDLCTDFRGIINGRGEYKMTLDEWLPQAGKDSSEALRSFAKGIEGDIDAVKNAIIMPLSNGLLEGTVNKVKAIKRMMYNRFSTKLLYVRVVAWSS